MVHGQAEVNFGYGTVLMIPCHNDDDGRYGLAFRSREPGDVTEKEMEVVEKAINSGDIDVILTFKSPENIENLVDMLQAIKEGMESEMAKQEE